MDQTPPPAPTEAPPILPPPAKKNSGRRLLALLLSFCLGLFLFDAIISVIDDALIFTTGVHGLSLLRGLVSFATLLMAFWLYVLIGITPAVPKRLFLPIPLFFLASLLAMFTLAIFWYHQIEAIGLAVSSAQLLLGIVLLLLARREKSPEPISQSDPLNPSVTPENRMPTTQPSAGTTSPSPIGWERAGVRVSLHGKTKSPWPLFSPDQLHAKIFTWRNLFGFVFLNIFVLLPIVSIYLFTCSARAVNHFSEGFMALHPGGFTVQVRKYVRDDGKAIQLFPMAHVAAPSFYQQVAQTFPTNAVILMEGVSDEGNLLTNKISYKRMAQSLGLAEQKETFAPNPQEVVRADVDVGVFSRETIDFLNLIMLFHSRGMTSENVTRLMQYTPPPGFEKQLFDDLLTKRNEHLLGEIRANLQTSDNIMVPWGVAHMPGLAREIQKAGFHLSETRDYVVIPFGKRAETAGK
jgi:hypothetical protein